MLKSIVLSAMVLVGLAACVANDNPLPTDTLASLKLTDVAVVIAPDAHLNYTTAEDEFAAERGVDIHDMGREEALIHTPEAIAFIRGQAVTKMRDAFRTTMGPVLVGTHPVRIEVGILKIDIPGAARSIVLSGTAVLTANVKLIDAVDGKVINAMPTHWVFAARGSGLLGTAFQAYQETSNGVAGPYERLCDDLAHEYLRWLFPARNA